MCPCLPGWGMEGAVGAGLQTIPWVARLGEQVPDAWVSGSGGGKEMRAGFDWEPRHLGSLVGDRLWGVRVLGPWVGWE